MLIVLGGALLLLMPLIAFADEPPKNVLLFHSDDPNMPGAVLITQAIRSTLKDKWKSPIQIFDEGQDSFRIPNEKYEAELVALLQRKYEGVHFDLIFTLAPPALRFLLKHKGELFRDAPVVFIVNEQKRIADLKLENTTGVSGTIEVAPTLDLALAFHPQTERVVVAAGNSPLERDLMALAQKDFRAYEDRLAFTYLTDVTSEEMRQRLAVLPDKTIVIFLSFNIDRNGKAYISTDVLPQLAESCSVPIYAQNQTYFGSGIVGGRLISYEAVGLRAAEIGVRILAGERAQNIPPQTVPSVTMVDWRQLSRWGINETQIPPGSVVRYKEFSVWELYKWQFVGGISLIVLQALGIVWLLFTRAKRRQAEERSTRFARLAESEHQHLDEIVAKVPGVVWEARLEADDPIPKTTFVSPYVGKMLGYSVEEWLCAPGFAQSIILEEDRGEATREIGAILESGREGVLRFRWRAKDGRLLWVESHMAPIRDETGKTVGLRGVTLDISERMQTEEAKNNLAAIVESSDDAILSKTLEGTIKSWNAGAEKMYGYSASEIVGEHVTTLAPAELKKEVAGILEQIQRGESVDHLETVRITKDGRRIDVSLTISPIRNEDMIVIGASTIARDITARKKAEAEAIEQRAELAHLSRVTMLGELSGSLAHELNQPLTSILSNAQAAKRFLAHDNVDLDEVRDILTDIVDQDKRAGEVIHRLRLLLKKGEVQQQPFDVNNAVQEVLKLLRSDLANQGVTMRTKLAPALPTVKGDRVQLQQVLLNLVMNACDGMNGNASADRQMVVCTELSNGEGIRFSVSDRGAGIAPEKLEQVFEPFFTTKTHGLGLGLSVCRTIITAHGGKLWAANNPERGATFHFTLPVNTEANL